MLSKLQLVLISIIEATYILFFLCFFKTKKSLDQGYILNKLQKLEKTESGEVSFKIALPNWAEGDKLKELNLVLIENADDVFTEIIFEKE